MTRYGIFAYLLVLVGMVLNVIYGISHYIQAAYAYQIANHIPPRVEEGSFWMTVNGEPFLYPGAILTIIGLTMVIHEGITSAKASRKRNAEAVTQ